MTLPQAAIALISRGEDMGWQLSQAVLPVQVYGSCIVQTRDGLVGVDRCQDGANVRLQGENKTQQEHNIPGKPQASQDLTPIPSTRQRA